MVATRLWGFDSGVGLIVLLVFCIVALTEVFTLMTAIVAAVGVVAVVVVVGSGCGVGVMDCRQFWAIL